MKANLLKTALVLGALSSSIAPIHAQEEVVQGDLNYGKLLIMPSISFAIPYVPVMEITAMANVEANYLMPELGSVYAIGSVGTFKGLAVGGTYFIRSVEKKQKKTNFLVASVESGRTRTNYFYTNLSDYRTMMGPTAGVKMGIFSKSGFYSRFQAGLDYQIVSRVFFKGYPSVRNGYHSIKLLGVASKMNLLPGAFDDNYTLKDGVLGVGLMASIKSVLKPWKGISLFAEGELGYMRLLGENDNYIGSYLISKQKDHYILEFGIGASINIAAFGKKKN